MTLGFLNCHQLPSGWRQSPLLAVAKEVKSKNTGLVEQNLLSLSYGRIVSKDIDGVDGLLPASFEGYNRVRAGDLVLRLTDLQNDQRSLRTGLVGENGIITSAYLTLRPAAVDARYFAYVMHAYDVGKTFYTMGGGLRQGMGFEDLKRVTIPLPPLDVQRRIADFLDDQVARIGRAVAARQRQMAVLDEALMSVGDKALEGLDHAGPPLSAVATIVDTEHKTAPSVPGGGCWIAGTSAIRDGVLVHGNLRETDERGYREWTRRATPQQGDVLLTREAPVGEVALLLPSDPQVAIGQRVVLLRPRQGTSGGFLRAVLMSFVLRRVIQNATQGSLHPHLNMSDIARLRVPDCGRETQERVASEHAVLLEQVKSLRTYLLQSVHLLEERKRSLITAAVTGEFDA